MVFILPLFSEIYGGDVGVGVRRTSGNGYNSNGFEVNQELGDDLSSMDTLTSNEGSKLPHSADVDPGENLQSESSKEDLKFHPFDHVDGGTTGAHEFVDGHGHVLKKRLKHCKQPLHQ